MKNDPLKRLRQLCLALPDTIEKEAWGGPTFRVRGRMFAMYTDNHHGDGRVAVWCAAGPGVQEVLVGADPKHFFVPPYMGPKGWIGVHLDKGLDWEEIAEHLKEACEVVAPAGRPAAPARRGRSGAPAPARAAKPARTVNLRPRREG